MRSLKNKWNLEKPTLEITEGFIVEVVDNPVDIMDASAIAMEAQKYFEDFENIENPTNEEIIKMKEQFKNAQSTFEEAIKTLIANEEDFEKIKKMRLSFNNLSILFAELMKVAEHIEEDEEEEKKQ